MSECFVFVCRAANIIEIINGLRKGKEPPACQLRNR